MDMQPLDPIEPAKIKDTGGSAGCMSIRDYFAGQAMIAILNENMTIYKNKSLEEGTARLAYLYADAMIKQRGESNG